DRIDPGGADEVEEAAERGDRLAGRRLAVGVGEARMEARRPQAPEPDGGGGELRVADKEADAPARAELGAQRQLAGEGVGVDPQRRHAAGREGARDPGGAEGLLA